MKNKRSWSEDLRDKELTQEQRRASREFIFRIFYSDYPVIKSHFESVAMANHCPEEVVSDAIYNMLRYAEGYKGSCQGGYEDNPDLQVWSNTILRNCISSYFSRSKKSNLPQIVENDIARSIEERAYEYEPFRRSCENEERRKLRMTFCIFSYMLWNAYLGLPKEQKELIRLIDIEGRSYDDVSRKLGIEKKTLKVRVFRARRSILRNMGIYETNKTTPIRQRWAS